MNKQLILPLTILSLGLTGPAFAIESSSETKTTVQEDTKGNFYKKQSKSAESVDAEGTATNTEVKVEVEQTPDGDAKRIVTTETSTDPKGLLNKSKTKTTDSITYKDGKIEKEFEKQVDGKTVEATKEAVVEN